MRTVMVLLAGLLLGLPLVVGCIGCEENERVVERREKVQLQSEPKPVVMPDAPER